MKNEILFNNKPFTHLIWNNFLPSMILESAIKGFNNLNVNDFSIHPHGYKFAPCKEIEFLKYIYSQKIRREVEYYFNRKIVRSKKYPFPQFYEFPENSPGLPPHTDSDEKRDIAMIIYLNENWSCQDGGELVIMSDANNELSKVEPVLNRMVCLNLNKSAWHAVNQTSSNFKRKTLIIDWDFE